MSATITVSREPLLALMQEAYAVCTVLELLSGAEPISLTEQLGKRLNEMQDEIFGQIQTNATGEVCGPHTEMWEAADADAREFLGSFAQGEAVAS